MSDNTKKITKIVKKKRINKKRVALLIAILILIIGIFIFSIVNIFKFFSSKTEKTQVSKVSSSSENIEQFNLQDEKKDSIGKTYKVFIDPGHGGKDSGSIMTEDKNVLEKDINLQIAKKVASILLKQNDIQVILSRTDDTFIDLTERANMANKQGADVFVSIHLNSFPNVKEASGIETYYTEDDSYHSEQLATAIQETMVSYVDARDRGIKTDEFKVLKESKMPSVLVEAGFLSHPEEAKKLQNEEYQSELAQGIAQGILTYLDEYLGK